MASVCRPAVIATARSVFLGSGTAFPKSFLSRRAVIIVSRPLSSALGGLESASPLHNAIASARLISNLAVDASYWSWLSQGFALPS